MVWMRLITRETLEEAKKRGLRAICIYADICGCEGAKCPRIEPHEIREEYFVPCFCEEACTIVHDVIDASPAKLGLGEEYSAWFYWRDDEWREER